MDSPPALARSRDLIDGLPSRRYLFAEHRLAPGAELPPPAHPHDYRTFLVTAGSVLLEQPGQAQPRRYHRMEGWHAAPGSVYRCRNDGDDPVTLLEAGSVGGEPRPAGEGNGACLDLSGYTVRKPWGHEVWYTENLPAPGYAVKQIHMTAGHRSSLQSHRQKAETNLVIEGEATVLNGAPAPADPGLAVNAADLPLTVHPAGSGWSSAPNVLHRVIANSAYTAIEVSTPELDDVIRWSDDAGRPDGRIKAEHDGSGQ